MIMGFYLFNLLIIIKVIMSTQLVLMVIEKMGRYQHSQDIALYCHDFFHYGMDMKICSEHKRLVVQKKVVFL
jgi:hypothetical protein